VRNIWAATMRRATLANIASKVRLMQGVGPFLHLCKPRFTRSDAGGGRDEPSARLHVRVFSAEHGVDRRVPRPAAWPGTGFVRRAVDQVRRIKRPGLSKWRLGRPTSTDSARQLLPKRSGERPRRSCAWIQRVVTSGFDARARW